MRKLHGRPPLEWGTTNGADYNVHLKETYQVNKQTHRCREIRRRKRPRKDAVGKLLKLNAEVSKRLSVEKEQHAATKSASHVLETSLRKELEESAAQERAVEARLVVTQEQLVNGLKAMKERLDRVTALKMAETQALATDAKLLRKSVEG